MSPATLVEELEVLLLEHEVGSEVLLAHGLVGGKFLRSALEEYATLKEEVSAVGDIQSLVDIMVGDENADIAELQLPDDMLDVLHSDRVDTGKRLVEHDELWVDGQTARYLRTAALTTRQAVALVLADASQVGTP